MKGINIAHGDQEAFLCNENNKAQFVSLLAKGLFQSGNKVLICEEDSDTKIAEIAIAIAMQNKTVTVICDDTDVFVILIHHYNVEEMSDIIFKSEAAKKSWSIDKIIASIGSIVQKHILFLHAWTGCDTTSAIFGHGKTSLLKKIKQHKYLQQLSAIISDKDASKEDVMDAGQKVFLIMHGGKVDDTLTNLR